MDTRPLEKLGLHEAEIKIYLALLKKGLSTATELSQHTGLNRSHIYDKIDVLLEKGLISFVIKNNVKYFKASKPERIIDYLKEIQQNIESIIPNLQEIRETPKHQTVVELYQGKEGLKTVLKDIIRDKKDYIVFGEEGQFQETLPIFIQQFLRDIKNCNLHEKLISKEAKKGKIVVTDKHTEIKYLPDKYFSPVTTAVYGDKTAIFIWSDPLFVILIKDKGVANSFSSYFSIFWKLAGK